MELSHGRECTDNVYCLKRGFFFTTCTQSTSYNFCCILYKQMTLFTTDCMVEKTNTTNVTTPQTFATGISTSSMKKVKCSSVKVLTPRVKSEEMGSLSQGSMPFRGSCTAAFFSLSFSHTEISEYRNSFWSGDNPYRGPGTVLIWLFWDSDCDRVCTMDNEIK